MENMSSIIRMGHSLPLYLFTWSADLQQSLVNELTIWQQSKKDNAPLFSLAKQLLKRYDASEQFRLIIVVNEQDDVHDLVSQAIDALSQPESKVTSGNIFIGTQRLNGRCAFLFPGQGSQYLHMLNGMAAIFPQVKEAFLLGDAVTKGKFEKSLSEFIFPDEQINQNEAELKLRDTHVAQPALGCASLGLFRLLQQLGVKADVVAGHSYGEYVALCAADVIDAERLIHLSEVRGRCMAKSSNDKQGTMLAVKSNIETIKSILGQDSEIVFANLNAPTQTVLSGRIAAIEQAENKLNKAKIRTLRLNVSNAFHSPLMTSAQSEFSTYLSGLDFSEPSYPVYANISAQPYGKSDAIAQQLCEHLTSPVLFLKIIEEMYEDGVRLFIEVGSHNILTTLTQKILRGKTSYRALATNHAKYSDIDYFFKTIAQLMALGTSVDLSWIYEQYVEI